MLGRVDPKHIPAELRIARPGVDAQPERREPARPSRKHASHNEILAKFGPKRR